MIKVLLEKINLSQPDLSISFIVKLKLFSIRINKCIIFIVIIYFIIVYG